MVEEICDIIGHHHHPREEETLNFQILYESDWLVNMEEKGLSQDRGKVLAIIEESFRTEAGRQIAEKLFYADKVVGQCKSDLEKKNPDIRHEANA